MHTLLSRAGLIALCAVTLIARPTSSAAADSTTKRGRLAKPLADLPTPPPLPVVDLSGETRRHVIIAQGTAEVYQGHPTTVLLPDDKTIYCVWSIGHGGFCGPMKRSDDGGRTWSDLLAVPDSWRQVKNCPAIYRLADPQGRSRLFVFASHGPDGNMHQACSTDEGKSWSDMASTGLQCVMPFCTVAPIKGGKALLGMTNLRRPGEKVEKRSNVVAQSLSTDGGLTWGPWRIVCDLPGLAPCEPALVRSPNGRQLLCLMRENNKAESCYMTSDDEGETWSASKRLPPGLVGDRHMPRYAPDGRLLVCFRDKTKAFGTYGHFVAWLGRYEDIGAGRQGQCRIKLLHSHAGGDCGYPGLELSPDGNFLATTYIKYKSGEEKHSVVSTRFTLAEIDSRLASLRRETDARPPAKSHATKGSEAAAKVAPEVRVAKSAPPGEMDGKSYDLVVVGATPGGIACAVRAAREGCTVLLVQHNHVLGGMMANGLMQWDALYGGHRAPLFSELLENIEKHYRDTFGEDSRDVKVVHFTHQHYPMGWAEPHVAQREFNRLVAGEKRLTLLLKHYPTAVDRAGARLRGITLREFRGDREIRVRAAMFIDATYEGDLLALAKVPYRVGREARDEYREPHAGKVFTNIDRGQSPRDAVEGRLNIHPYSARQGSIDPTSPFTADGAVQAYNFRFCVTRDAANRILPGKPDRYNREEYLHYDRKSIATNAGPNHKSHMNSPILPGENHAYPEASWGEREKIIQRHLDFALGLMYFLQNDESVSVAGRAKFREWGLPKDEFLDNNHLPYEMYVREARRIVGRVVYTEHDNSLAPGLGRTPVHADSVAITDWYMDSHCCTTESRPGYHYDGKLILTEESRPGQIPYRALLPQGVDNLLVPVCLSATHVAWGAVRLEPVWMETGEAAGFAAALAKQNRTSPAALAPDLLLRTLVRRQMLVSFFNDAGDPETGELSPSAQYFGAKGFFHDYNSRLNEPLKRSTGKAWAEGFASLRAGRLDPNATARAVAKAEAEPATIAEAEFATLLPTKGKAATNAPSDPMTRKRALDLMFSLLE